MIGFYFGRKIRNIGPFSSDTFTTMSRHQEGFLFWQKIWRTLLPSDKFSLMSLEDERRAFWLEIRPLL
jgi:hypothetical protein